MTDEIATALQVARALEAVGARYLIGGSLASSYAGEPRSTLDVDMVAELSETAAGELLTRLEPEFYADADSALAAVRRASSFNLIHQRSGIKVDVFVAHSPLDRLQMDRRQAVDVGGGHWLFFYTPEDILLQKLRWYRSGGEISERQWRDVMGIIRAQAERLDRAYLHAQAPALGVAGLLARVLEAQP